MFFNPVFNNFFWRSCSYFPCNGCIV